MLLATEADALQINKDKKVEKKAKALVKELKVKDEEDDDE
jgi:hypothetical protein